MQVSDTVTSNDTPWQMFFFVFFFYSEKEEKHSKKAKQMQFVH